LGLGQEWDQDQRSNANEREWEVTNKGQWLVRNVGVIRESGDHQSEEEKEEKGDTITAMGGS